MSMFGLRGVSVADSETNYAHASLPQFLYLCEGNNKPLKMTFQDCKIMNALFLEVRQD